MLELHDCCKERSVELDLVADCAQLLVASLIYGTGLGRAFHSFRSPWWRKSMPRSSSVLGEEKKCREYRRTSD